LAVLSLAVCLVLTGLVIVLVQPAAPAQAAEPLQVACAAGLSKSACYDLQVNGRTSTRADYFPFDAAISGDGLNAPPSFSVHGNVTSGNGGAMTGSSSYKFNHGSEVAPV
jgi:hypothetical protein